MLDTNVAIQILNRAADLAPGHDAGVETFLCLTVVGELFFGAARSSTPQANHAKIQRLLDRCPLAPHDIATARRYGEIKAALRQKGRPIPENDIWIAACALQYELILATRDRHFEEVADLQTEVW